MTETERAQIHPRLGRDGALTPEPWKDVELLWQEVSRLKQSADNYRLASLGMFDPVRVGQVVAQLQMERDEAPNIATHLMEHSVDCWAYKAELMEAYPWMKGRKE